MTKLRVLIADDEPLIRAGLRDVLGRVASVEIVGEASTGEETAPTGAAIVLRSGFT